VPIATPAAILIQFQLMRIITHSNRGYDQSDGADADDDSDSDDESALIEAKPPPSPLCIEVVVSDSADTTPQLSSRELEKTITQRTSPQSPTQDKESVPLLAPMCSAIPSSAVGSGAMIMPTENELAAINIVHFNDMSIEVDDDDDVVGHSTLPPLTTSRLWLLWSAAAAGEWRRTGKQLFSSFDHNTVVSV